MKIAIATVQVPFIWGGAEYLAQGLLAALRKAGHETEIISMPFRFNRRYLRDGIRAWRELDFTTLDAGSPDGVIGLKFPAYNVAHPNRTAWVLHQHRAVYDLLDTPWGEDSSNPEVAEICREIVKTDGESLGSVKACYTIARTVSDRLQRFNDLTSSPLYHPPPGYETYSADGPIFPYVFAPSRLEQLKRQDLLIRAMTKVDPAVSAIISGTGGMETIYRKLAQQLNVENRVRFVGHISEEKKRRYYENSLGVFFGPYQEDLGYVTLEAMLSAKPVISCRDSGGPTEFVRHEETGFLCDPDPEAIADGINALWKDRRRAAEMGRAGRERYGALNISWDNVVSTLVGALS